MPLLFLLLLGGTAAAPTPESLYRAAAAAPPQKANAIAIEALKRYGNSDDPWVWRLRTIRADALTTDGKADVARALLRNSLPQSLRDSEVEVMWLVSQVYAGDRLGDPKVASQIERAYVLAKKKYPYRLADVLVFRAIVDPDNTPKWMDEAIRHLARYPDATHEHRVRGMMGLYLAQNERFDEAIPMWEQALVREQQLHLEAYVQKTEGNLGWAYRELGDYEQAAELFERALATASRLSRYDMVPWTYQLGNVRLQQGDLAAAERQFLAALKLADEIHHLQRPIILSLLASYNLRVGRIAEARRYVDESLRQAKAAKNVEYELAALMIAGRINVAEGKFAEGERLLRNVLTRGKRSMSTTAEAHGRLAQLNEKRGDFIAARGQFRLMLEKVFEARESIDDEQLRFSFFTAVSELLDAYVDFLGARGQWVEALAITEASRAQTLGEALPDLGKARDVRTIARDTGATILCYWLGSQRSYLWIVTPRKVDVAMLPPRRTIDDAVEAYKRELIGPRGTLKLSGARGSELWQILVAPAARSIAPGSRVIVVPDGSLHAFNMETLVVPGPKPRYWIDDAVISTTASLALLVRHDGKTDAAPRLLMVGDTPPPSREFVPLPRASLEMQQIAQHFERGRAVRLSGVKATPAAYRNASPEGFTYLHFVAHGVAMRQKPLDSAIVLARDGTAFKLYARDIARQPLTARLVTISSCHGAGTRAYAGEGLVGLGWAFLRAGADNVVAALWEVSDAATPDLMDEFYARLAKGAHPAIALRDAKLALKAKGGVFARPFYWAPFLLYGSS
ncbi:MAG TPA: CHAT domain-containing tetratricopeptide repeat protein [Thermoanaerobaculia bacterium]|nr:CHAT domain-containing tetratricopeptide repeat protein [Thermoanaerobaculia bacterium]